MDNIFYVYEHWRPDLDVCFYVGKGKGNRAYDLVKKKHHRNKHHKNIQEKLKSLGMGVEVRFYKTGLTEKEAFDIEIERIAFWKDLGVNLANGTNGGEGVAGARWKQTPEHSAKISKALKGRKFSEETLIKMSIGAKGNKRRVGKYHNLEIRAKISAIVKIRMNDPEVKAKVSIARKNFRHTEESKAKISKSLIGNKRTFGHKHKPESIEKMSIIKRGKVQSEETRAKISAANKGRKRSKRQFSNV